MITAAPAQDGGGFIPPRPPTPDRDLTGPSLLRTMRANSLAAWPARSYAELMVHRRFLNVDCYLVNDPAGARHVLAATGERYDRPVAARRLLRPGAAGGVLDAEGQRAQALRRQLAPAFSPASIEGWLPRVNAASQAMLAGLRAGERVNLAAALEDMALDAAGRTMFSLALPRDVRARIRGLLRGYFSKAARATIWDFLARGEDDYWWAAPGRAAFSRRWFEEVDAIIGAQGGSSGRSGPAQADVLGHLTAGGDGGRPAEIRGQVASLLAAGYETTARAMFWTIYLLSRDTATQARVRSELTAFPPSRLGGLADLKRWPTLRLALLEALRLYPPASVFSRTALENDTIAGVKIRKGSLLMISPWTLHRHQRHWRDPDRFVPDRFAGREPPPSGEGAYMPFGAGRRTCLGAVYALSEATIGLANLLATFEVSLEDPRPVLPVAIVSTVPSIEPDFRLRRLADV
jgi:unspecific monooxygenase